MLLFVRSRKPFHFVTGCGTWMQIMPYSLLEKTAWYEKLVHIIHPKCSKSIILHPLYISTHNFHHTWCSETLSTWIPGGPFLLSWQPLPTLSQQTWRRNKIRQFAVQQLKIKNAKHTATSLHALNIPKNYFVYSDEIVACKKRGLFVCPVLLTEALWYLPFPLVTRNEMRVFHVTSHLPSWIFVFTFFYGNIQYTHASCIPVKTHRHSHSLEV